MDLVDPPERRPVPSPGGDRLTVIVPAYDEAASLADTVLSLQGQTSPPREIIVDDDGSTDGTGEVARALGATVLRPPANTGSKAGAQTFALRHKLPAWPRNVAGPGAARISSGLALALAIAIAAAMRLGGLPHDLPYSYFGDELQFVR